MRICRGNRSETAVRQRSDAAGFTMLELLVTVSILAATAVIAVGTYAGVHRQTDELLVRVEMQEIAKAIQRFRQDTGYYPKTGPFDLKSAGGEVVTGKS
ncbi:MAG: prepilin-type N-terminal cleavage/methylation domain-containing protein, partial [Acidobacteriota bacterium]|nr:prepilin-type N-terminal cleavage/methylation domain-containing protein [Acidobacteriota bacterium]